MEKTFMGETARIARKYRLLFSLPSLETMILEVIGGGIAIGFIIAGIGLCFNAHIAFLPNLMMHAFGYSFSALLSALLAKHVLGAEVLTLRRLIGLSLITMVIGGIAQITLSAILASLTLKHFDIATLMGLIVGAGLMLYFRFITIRTLEERSLLKCLIASFTQPIALLMFHPLLYVDYVAKLRSFTMFAVASALFAFSAAGTLKLVDLEGAKHVSIDGIKLFRAFMKNWLTGAKKPMESLLEKICEKRKLYIWCIVFSPIDEHCYLKQALIIPQIHFGPFKNIGSSQLPSMIMDELQKEGIESIVLHGVAGHENNLVSEEECRRVISIIKDVIRKSRPTLHKATAIATGIHGSATAYCTIFGNVALIILTRAPHTTEDPPRKVEDEITAFCMKKLKLKNVCIVDAHNSIIDDEAITEEDWMELIIAAKKALIRALEKEEKSIEIGMSRCRVEEFFEEQGIGRGGIAALVIEVDGDEQVYVVIDGNNMVPDFRMKIISELKKHGFERVEVLTTDTHSVNALKPGGRGYHPVGEAIDQEILLRYIVNQAEKARKQKRAVSYVVEKIEVHVKVLGEKAILGLANAVEGMIRVFKAALTVSVAISSLITIFMGVLIP